MAEDNINYRLIEINQLLFDKEHPKRAVPLYYQAMKIAADSEEAEANPRTLNKLKNSFINFRNEYQSLFIQFDQVHMFMLEESERILEEQLNKSAILSQKIASQIKSSSPSKLQQQIVVLEQQIYFLEEKDETDQSSYIDPIKLPSNAHLLSESKINLQSIPSAFRSDKYIQNIYQRMEEYYGDHRLDEAYQQFINFKKNNILLTPNCKICPQKKEFTNRLQQQYELMTHYYHFFEEPGYIFDKEDGGVQLSYKIHEDSNQVSVKVQAEVQISIQVFLCIATQIDLFQKFVPFSYDTQTLRSISRNQKIGLTRVYLPLLSDREAYFYAAAYDRLKKHNSIFFYSKTITSDLEFQKKIGYKVQPSDLVELQYKYYILEYQPIDAKRGKVRLATNIDLKLSFLPNFIINKTCRMFAFDYFKNMIKVSKRLKGSEWEKKMEQNKEVYDFFKNRIRTFLEENQSLQK